MQKYFFTISAIIFITLHSELRAQGNSNAKVDTKTAKALAERNRRDLAYSQSARMATNNNLNWWLGQKLSDLVARWGAYTRIVDDAAGGKIVVYETFVSGTSGGYTPASLTWDGYGDITSYRPAQDTRSSYSYTAFREVYVDQNNLITRIKTGTR